MASKARMSEPEPTADTVPEFTTDVNPESVQFVMYFKLGSRKSVNKSEKHKKRIEEAIARHQEIKTALLDHGMQLVELWRSEDGMKYHWGVTASEERLRRHAEITHYELRLRPQYGGSTAPYFASYAHLFQEVDGSVFTELDRQRIVLSLASGRAERDGAEQDMTLLYRTGVLYKFFPLHKRSEQRWLWDNWVKRVIRKQPIDQIRDYFGEKVGFYFGYLGYSLKWLLPVAVLGLIIFLSQQIKTPAVKKWTYVGSVIWSVIMPVWATLFVEFWKRKSQARAVRWGMDTLDLAEPSRPSYTGTLRVGTWWGKVWIDLQPAGEKDPKLMRYNIYENPNRRVRRLVFGTWPILILMTLVSLGVAWLFILFNAMVSSFGARIAVSAVNGVVIVILSIIYRVIAKYLTELENLRTDTALEDSLIMKIFVFDFINAFSTLFYQAFLKYNVKWTSLGWISNGSCTHLTGTDKFDCALGELSTMLITVFIVRICFFQMLDFLIPFLYTKIGTKASHYSVKLSKSGRIMCESQIQSKMAPFAGTLDEYSGMVMQFAYVTLLAAACPLGPVIALISYFLESRTDAYKMLYLNQRAPAVRAKDIGTYQQIIQFISFISIVSNAALVALSDGPSSSDLAWRLSLIIIGENLIVAIKFIIGKIVAKRPASVDHTLAKRSFIREELMGQENPRILELGFHAADDIEPESPGTTLASFHLLKRKLRKGFASVRSIKSWRTTERTKVQVGDFIANDDRKVFDDSDSEEDGDASSSDFGSPFSESHMDADRNHEPLVSSRNASSNYNATSSGSSSGTKDSPKPNDDKV